MSRPEISYILATDTVDTVSGVLEHLARQTRVDAIEVVLISPEELEHDLHQVPPQLTVRVLRTASPLRLAEARAIGVRAAAAPLVFIGETHSYPEPEMIERLIESFAGPWSAVVPTLVNANPKSPTSCASFVLDYGSWNADRAAGEVAEPLVYNAAYRRDPLIALGDALADRLSSFDRDLWRDMSANGHRAAFEPAARLRHLNVAPAGAMLHERAFCGARLGQHRAQHWPLARRLIYFLASPLVPFVLAARARPGIRYYRATGTLPRWTSSWIVVALVARAAGEAFGYLGWGSRAVAEITTEFEVHKMRYAVDRS